MLIGAAGAVTCKTRTATNALTATSCTLDTTTNLNYFIVHMPVPCPISCPPATSYTVELSGVRNPEWIMTT